MTSLQLPFEQQCPKMISLFLHAQWRKDETELTFEPLKVVVKTGSLDLYVNKIIWHWSVQKYTTLTLRKWNVLVENKSHANFRRQKKQRWTISFGWHLKWEWIIKNK